MRRPSADCRRRKSISLNTSARSGVYTVPSGRTINVLQAVAAAGGSLHGDSAAATVIRGNPGGGETTIMNSIFVKELSDKTQPDVNLQPGDVVHISSAEYYID